MYYFYWSNTRPSKYNKGKIIKLKECCVGYNITTILATWEPSIGSYQFSNINYLYNYNKQELIEQLKDIVDIYN